MERIFPSHWDMTNFERQSPGGVRLDVYESVLANGMGGVIFEGLVVRIPWKGGRQNGIQKYGS